MTSALWWLCTFYLFSFKTEINPTIDFEGVMFSNLQTLQEEVAAENQQKIEAEKQSVHEAKTEFDKHRKMSEDTDSKYSSVRERIGQLSEDMEPLKVQHSILLSLCSEFKISFRNQKNCEQHFTACCSQVSVVFTQRFCPLLLNIFWYVNCFHVKLYKLTLVISWIILSGVVKMYFNVTLSTRSVNSDTDYHCLLAQRTTSWDWRQSVKDMNEPLSSSNTIWGFMKETSKLWKMNFPKKKKSYR